VLKPFYLEITMLVLTLIFVNVTIVEKQDKLMRCLWIWIDAHGHLGIKPRTSLLLLICRKMLWSSQGI